jgi:hypothetical protein
MSKSKVFVDTIAPASSKIVASCGRSYLDMMELRLVLDGQACQRPAKPGCSLDFTAVRGGIMRSNSSGLIGRITDVLDETIPSIPVDDEMSAPIGRIRQSTLKAAADEQVSYERLLVTASTEINLITIEMAERASTSSTW